MAETAAVCITEDCTLTARWTANTYTIVFHGNGGRLASGDTVHMILCTYDEEIQLPANEFVLEGWEFVCWQRKLAEDGAVLANFGDGQTVTNLTFEQGGEVHLYAAWEEKCAASYTLILDANGGAVSTDRMTVVVGETYDLPTPARTGYSFAGWYLDGAKVSTGDTIELTGNATLTAKWTAHRYAIVYDLNGGSLLPGQTLTRQVCTYGLSAKLSTVVPKKSGETFIGWGLSPDGPVVYAAGAIVKNLTAEHQATVTLYALWRSSGSTPVPDVPEFPDEGGTYSLRSAETTENSYVKTYEYDLAGNRTSFTLTKDGETVHNVVYQYDVLNRLVGLVQDGETVAEYTYDTNGNRATLTYATGTVTTYSYNLANWVTGMTATTDGTVLTDYSYTYYADGNRESETDSVNSVVTTYIYDDLGRLVQESESNGLTVNYTYDSAGNRIQMVVTGEENYTTTYAYDANNRLTQEVRAGEATLYTYDDNGNLLRKGTVDCAELYEYNGFNQLVVLKQGDGGAAYGYNASGIRVSKQVGNTYTYFLLDGGDVVAECEDGLLSAIYTRGFNLVYRLTMDGMEFYLHDAHGDVVALTDGFGAATKRYSYDAFGNEENPSDFDTNPFRYCGEYFDKETKTYYLRARYYDPAIGRFTQQDTHWSPANMIYGDNPRKIYEGQDALGLSTCTYAPEITAIMQSGNLYVYCTNSPVMYSDFSGNFVLSTAALLAIGGFIIFGTIGGLIGNHIAEENGATGWEKAGYIAGGVVVLGALGAAAGYCLAPTVVSATGFCGISVGFTGISTVNIGAYGTLVAENPGINVDWSLYARHGLRRMAERGITQEMVDAWVKNGKVLQQSKDKFMFITREGVAVVTAAGRLVTTYSSADFDSKIQAVVEALFRGSGI